MSSSRSALPERLTWVVATFALLEVAGAFLNTRLSADLPPAELSELRSAFTLANGGATLIGAALTFFAGSRPALLVTASAVLAGAILSASLTVSPTAQGLVMAAPAIGATPALYLLAQVWGKRRLYGVPLCIVAVGIVELLVAELVFPASMEIGAFAQSGGLGLLAVTIAVGALKCGGDGDIEDASPRVDFAVPLAAVAWVLVGRAFVRVLLLPQAMASPAPESLTVAGGWITYAAECVMAFALFRATRSMPSPHRFVIIAVGLAALAGCAHLLGDGTAAYVISVLLDLARVVASPLAVGLVVSIFADRRVVIALMVWWMALGGAIALAASLARSM